MKYQFIASHRSTFGVEKMCRLLAVSRSGFYRWSQGGESKRTIQNRLLLGHIRRIHESTRGRYGAPRITAELRDQGYSCSRPRVARLMRRNGIKARTTRKFKVTTESRHTWPVAPNLLGQVFRTDSPNRIWASNMTYIPTLEGWLYLTVVMDLYHRKIVGWSMSERLQAEVTTIPAFQMAVRACRPQPGLMFHSDRGAQYACSEFVALLSRSRMIQSMSGNGNCYDNAVVESFYNRSRKHSTLGYRSPVEYETMTVNQEI